jgi:protein-tyrosine phosphatase
LFDLHSHVLPGIDDGARDLDGSLEILRAAAEDGITRIAATPHVRDDHPTTAAQMESALARVRELEAGVEVLPGGELDIGFAQSLDDDELRRFGLGGNPSLLLLETPFWGWPLNTRDAVLGFAVRGYTIVLAHPERNPDVQQRPEIVRELVDAGTFVQLTAASVDGRLGRGPERAARALLDAGLAHLIASDAHAPALRAIGMRAAAEAVGDAALATWLTQDVPSALVAGEQPPERPAGRRRRRLF